MKLEYSYTKDLREKIEKINYYYLTKVPREEKIKLLSEHSKSVWTTFEKSMNLFEFDNPKEILIKINDYLGN